MANVERQNDKAARIAALKAAKAQKYILVVDDDPDIVLMLQYKLEQEGYQVGKAFNGLEALDKIAERHPDLIVLDLMMPKVDGWIVCHSVKSTPDTSRIKIIILSAMSQYRAKTRGLSVQRADLYVTKPFDIDDLSEDIANLLNIPQTPTGR